jgi:hypothetical protein
MDLAQKRRLQRNPGQYAAVFVNFAVITNLDADPKSTPPHQDEASEELGGDTRQRWDLEVHCRVLTEPELA